MNICESYFKKEFSAAESKKAYLKACAWVATNIVSKENEDIVYSIKKSTDKENTFILTLYLYYNVKDVEHRFCESCKDFHRLFYVNKEYNCNRCSVSSFKQRIEERTKVKKQYKSERLKHILDKK